jgi:hypothetical protein
MRWQPHNNLTPEAQRLVVSALITARCAQSSCESTQIESRRARMPRAHMLYSAYSETIFFLKKTNQLARSRAPVMK